jgi:hypothetical protein
LPDIECSNIAKKTLRPLGPLWFSVLGGAAIVIVSAICSADINGTLDGTLDGKVHGNLHAGLNARAVGSPGAIISDHSCSAQFESNIHVKFDSFHLRENFWETGPHGGAVMYIERKSIESRSWGRKTVKFDSWSDYSTQPDVAGDIRKNTRDLPPELRKLFSIATLDRDFNEVHFEDRSVFYVKTPDINEIRLGLKELDDYLASPSWPANISTFYPASEIVRSKSHLQGIAYRHAHPMGLTGHIFEHDFNYHFKAELVKPPSLLRAIEIRAALLLELLDYVEKKSTAHPELKDLAFALEDKTLRLADKHFDLSANFAVVLFRPETHSTPLQDVFFGTETPEAYLRKVCELSGVAQMPGFANLFNAYLGKLSKGINWRDLPQAWYNPDGLALREALRKNLDRLEAAAKALNERRAAASPK